MLGLKIYRILTFILLPIEVLLGILALLSLVLILITGKLMALGDVFIMSCSVIYIFSSFTFLNKGIQQAKPIKVSLKHLIRVNAFVSIFFGIQLIVKVFNILFHPDIIDQLSKQGLSMQAKMPGATLELFEKMIKGMFYFVLAYAIMLLTHIMFTFRFLQQYEHLFDEA